MKSSTILNSALFIFFILVAKSPFNSSLNKLKLHERVTDPLIQRICRETTNPNLCTEILQQYRDKPLLPQPPTHAIKIANKKAEDIVMRMSAVERNIKDEKSEVKKGYLDCLAKYNIAYAELRKVGMLLQNNNYIESVHPLTSAAVREIRSCGEKLDNLVKEHNEPTFLSRENRTIYHLCSIVLAIFDAVLGPHK